MYYCNLNGCVAWTFPVAQAMQSTDVASDIASRITAIQKAFVSREYEKVHSLLDAEDLIFRVSDIREVLFFIDDDVLLQRQPVWEIVKKLTKKSNGWGWDQIMEDVAEINDVELFKFCFTDEEVMNLNSIKWGAAHIMQKMLRSGAGGMIAHLSHVLKPEFGHWWWLKAKEVWILYFQNTKESPSGMFTIGTHKEVISKLMEYGAKLRYGNSYALENLFRCCRMDECVKIELCDFLLSKGATLNDCNPKRSNYTLLQIAISRGEISCVQYLLSKARDIHEYRVNFSSKRYCNNMCTNIISAWVKNRRYNRTTKESKTLLFLLRHGCRLDLKSVKFIGTSLELGKQPELMDHLLKYQKNDMMSFRAWDWPKIVNPMRDFLWNHFADEFAETILLGTVHRLNRYSPLRECNEDVFIMVFEILFKSADRTRLNVQG